MRKWEANSNTPFSSQITNRHFFSFIIFFFLPLFPMTESTPNFAPVCGIKSVISFKITWKVDIWVFYLIFFFSFFFSNFCFSCWGTATINKRPVSEYTPKRLYKSARYMGCFFCIFIVASFVMLGETVNVMENYLVCFFSLFVYLFKWPFSLLFRRVLVLFLTVRLKELLLVEEDQPIEQSFWLRYLFLDPVSFFVSSIHSS